MIILKNFLILTVKLVYLLLNILINQLLTGLYPETLALKTILEVDLYLDLGELHLCEVDLDCVDCVVEVGALEGGGVGVKPGDLVVDVPVVGLVKANSTLHWL